MKILLLGLGLQGKAVIHDLEQSPLVKEIIAVDLNTEGAQKYIQGKNYRKTRIVSLNVSDGNALHQLIQKSEVEIVVCMLPTDLVYSVVQVAINCNKPFVSSNYTGRIEELNSLAEEKGVTVLPEMGLDPGIDLILGRLAIEEFEEVHGLYSYGGGLPEPSCKDDNPLHYKISWTFDGVLKSAKRPAKLLHNGQQKEISEKSIFKTENIHTLEFPNIGQLEAYPNGDAVRYIDIFNLKNGLKEMARFALRWPGTCRLFQTLAELRFLENDPLVINGCKISPRQFLIQHLTPQLQFKDSERDMVILQVQAWGIKNGQKRSVTYRLIDYRDLKSGLFAMNRTVGFTCSIAAQMILSKTITKTGVLSPIRDVEAQIVVDELKKRDMSIEYYEV
ncbi:MAG: saccharopine dehydrogenase C-terminal domain-containing protein [Desulfovermiculus sp.]|nr:saccharopine dehydrogenase C-terminal domain-containing protein [Desulfovermiculus sp.]